MSMENRLFRFANMVAKQLGSKCYGRLDCSSNKNTAAANQYFEEFWQYQSSTASCRFASSLQQSFQIQTQWPRSTKNLHTEHCVSLCQVSICTGTVYQLEGSVPMNHSLLQSKFWLCNFSAAGNKKRTWQLPLAILHSHGSFRPVMLSWHSSCCHSEKPGGF